MAAVDLRPRPLALSFRARLADQRPALAVLIAVAAAVRLGRLGGTPLVPFSDAAVRLEVEPVR
jgi:hypothetical protein